MPSPLTIRDEDASIVQTADGFAGMFAGNGRREIAVFDIPWRDALEVTIGLSAGTTLLLKDNLVTRVYGRTAGATTTLLAQQSFRGDPWRPNGTTFDYYFKRDHVLARVRGHVCDSYVVTIASWVLPTAASASDPNAVKGNRFSLQAIARGLQPSAVVEAPPTLWTNVTAGLLTVNNGWVVPGAGRLHQLVATNPGTTDLWLALFDDGPSNPNYTFTPPWTSVSAPTPPANGSLPRVPMLYVPPNGKGVASWDFGPRGLWAQFGLSVFLSSSPTTFTRVVPGANASVSISAQVS